MSLLPNSNQFITWYQPAYIIQPVYMIPNIL